MARKAKAAPVEETPVDKSNSTLAHDASTNAPPPFERISLEADDLFNEANNWLDGEPIASQDQADDLTKLIALIESTATAAEEERTIEKRPFLEGGRAVDAKWKPLTERLEKIKRTAKNALTPWLKAVEADKRRRAEEARREAAEKERIAQEASIAARQSAELREDDGELAQLHEEAQAARQEAVAVAREPVRTSGGGKAIGLRKFWMVNITDRRELLRYYLRERPEFREELETLLRKWAERDVRKNGARILPGCSIWSEDRAV